MEGKPARDFDLDRLGAGRLALNQAIKDEKATLEQVGVQAPRGAQGSGFRSC